MLAWSWTSESSVWIQPFVCQVLMRFSIVLTSKSTMRTERMRSTHPTSIFGRMPRTEADGEGLLPALNWRLVLRDQKCKFKRGIISINDSTNPQ